MSSWCPLFCWLLHLFLPTLPRDSMSSERRDLAKNSNLGSFSTWCLDVDWDFLFSLFPVLIKVPIQYSFLFSFFICLKIALCLVYVAFRLLSYPLTGSSCFLLYPLGAETGWDTCGNNFIFSSDATLKTLYRFIAPRPHVSPFLLPFCFLIPLLYLWILKLSVMCYFKVNHRHSENFYLEKPQFASLKRTFS